MERKHIVLFISTLLVHHSSCQLAALFDPASQPPVTATEKPRTSQNPDSTNPSSSIDQPVHDPPAALGVVGNDMTFPDSPPLDPLPPPLPPQDLHTFGPDQGASELSQIATELGLDMNFFADPISSSDSLNQGSASTLFANDANAATPSVHSVDSPVDPVPEIQKSLTELSGSSSSSDTAPLPGLDLPPVGGTVEKPKSLSELMGSSPSTGTDPSTEIDPSSLGGIVDPIQEKPKSLADLMGSSVSTDTAPPAGLSSVGGSTDFMHGTKSLSEMMSSSSASSDSIGLPVSGGPMGGGLNALMNSANTNQSPLPHTDPALETAARRQQQPQINDSPSVLPLPTTDLGMPRSVSDPAFRLPSISPQANLPGSSPFEQLPQTAAGGQLGSNHLSGGLPQTLPQGQSPGGPFPFGIPGGMMGDPRFGFPSLPIGQQTQQSASPSNNQQTSSQQGLESNTEIGFQGTGNAQAIAGQPPVDPRTAGMFPPFMPPGFTGFQQGASAMQAPAGNPMSVNNAQSGQAGGTQDPGNEQLQPRVPMFPPFMPPSFLPQNVPGARQPSNPAQTPAQGAVPANTQTSQDPSQVQRNRQMLPQAAMFPPFMSPAFFPQAVPGAGQPSNPGQTSTQGAVSANAQTSQDPSQVQRNQQMLPQAAMIPSQMSSPFFPQHFPGLRPQTSQTSPGQPAVPRVTDPQIRRSEPSLPPQAPMFLTPGSQLPPITRTGEPLNPLRPQVPSTNTLDRTQASQADPSLLPRAEQVLREVESLVHDLRSSSRSTANLPTAGEGYCPNGNPRVSCNVNPCDEVSCLNILDARCRPACDECSASFYVMERSGSQTSEKDVTDICMTVRWGRRKPGQGRSTPSTPTEPRGPVIEGPSGRRSNIPVPPLLQRGPGGRPLLLNPEDVIVGQSQVPRMPMTELFPRAFPRFPPGSPMDPRLPTRFQGLPGLPRSMLDPRLRRLGMRGATGDVEQAGTGPIVLPEIARLIRGGQLDRRELNAIRSRSMVGLRPSSSSVGNAVSNTASRPSNARNEVEQALMRFERQTSRRSV